MAIHFDEFAQKGKAILKEVAKELDTDDVERAGRMLRSVLRSLRNRLTIEESFQLLGQLPMCLKGIYVDGWKVRMDPRKITHISDFRVDVMKEDDWAALKDFYFEGSVDEAIKAVFKVLSRYVSASEIHHVMEVLPADLRMILEEKNNVE